MFIRSINDHNRILRMSGTWGDESSRFLINVMDTFLLILRIVWWTFLKFVRSMSSFKSTIPVVLFWLDSECDVLQIYCNSGHRCGAYRDIGRREPSLEVYKTSRFISWWRLEYWWLSAQICCYSVESLDRHHHIQKKKNEMSPQSALRFKRRISRDHIIMEDKGLNHHNKVTNILCIIKCRKRESFLLHKVGDIWGVK